MPKESIINRIRKSLQFKSKKVMSTELGASGTPIFSGIIDTGEYQPDLKGDNLIDVVNQMRWSDASVQLALLTISLPILSADWDIVPASEDSQDIEVAEFVKSALFEKISWEDNLRQALLMLPYGFQVFELIYKYDEDGKIIWRKWAPRMPKTIEKWNTEKGELKSITQTFYQEGNYETVEIPKEKLLIFVNQKEGDNYRGTSVLRQAYKHWYFRDKYYKIDAIATERHGVGVPVITLPEGYTELDKAEAEELGKNLRSNEQSYIIRPSVDWSIEMLDMKSNTIKDPQAMLEHHTREILKSVLAQFIDLGGKSVGSYALSKDQSAFFLNSMDTIAEGIENVINEQAIKPLVDMNFNVEEYPKINHGDLGITDILELSQALQSLTMSGIITPDVELEDYIRTVMKLPQLPDDIRDSVEKNKNKPKPEDDNEDKEVEEEVDNESEEEKEEVKASEMKWHRDLTKAEKRVRFDEIDRVMRTEEAKLYKELVKILLKEKSHLLPLFERAVQKNDLATLKNIAGRFSGEYERVFKNGIKKIFEFGKSKASFELGMAVPPTSTDMEEALYDKAHYYAMKGYSDLVDTLKATASLIIVNQEDTMSKIANAFKTFLNKNVKSAANLVISETINSGRKYAFEQNDDIYAFQWSALLDGGTCSYCRSMDGKTISASDTKSFNSYQPGRVHFNCRCIWVAVLKDDAPLPIFTGIPDSLKPQTEVPPWDFQDIEYPLPGSSAKDIDERLYTPEIRNELNYGIGVYKENKDD